MFLVDLKLELKCRFTVKKCFAIQYKDRQISKQIQL